MMMKNMKMAVISLLIMSSFIYGMPTRAEGIQYKEEGDVYYREGNYKKAAELYLKAWKHVKELPKEERLRMAMVVAWGSMLRNSEEMLRELKGEYPDDLSISISLARVLSWRGKNIEALKEIDAILSRVPGDPDALLIKGNILRWLGRPDRAMDFYQKAHQGRPDFDSALALSYGYMALDQRYKAKKRLEEMQPQYAYQARELEEGKNLYKLRFDPLMNLGYGYYKDSDDNIVNTLSFQHSWWIDNNRITLLYRHLWAEDKIREKQADDVSLRFYRRVSNSISLKVDFGVVSVGNSSQHLTGGASVSTFLGKGSLGAFFNSNILTYTAELIKNEVRLTNLGMSINQTFTDRISLYGAYQLRLYSDGNRADFVNITPMFKLMFGNPGLSLGYRFIYTNYDTHKRMGYFDPRNYVSNQILLSFQLEDKVFYVYAEPFVGHQRFVRYGKEHSDLIGGGFVSLGFKVKPATRLELNLEGGNYAMQSATGWKYISVGLSFMHAF